MRNLGIFLLSSIALLAVACQQEMSDMTSSMEEMTVRFTVNTPATLQSKADEPGSKIDRLYVEVYEDEYFGSLYGSTVLEGNKNTWDLELTLLKGKTYHMVLVAGCDGYITPSTTSGLYKDGITLIYTDTQNPGVNNACKEENDFFVATKTFTVSTEKETITLERPLAQINIYSDEFENGDRTDLVLGAQSATITSTSDGYNPLTGNADGKKVMTFVNTNGADEEGRIFMCYVLPEDSKENLVDIDLALEFTFNGQQNNAVYNLTNVPVKKNYRTNIHGNLFLGKADFTVTLDEFEKTEDIELWDGETTEPVEPDADDPNTYVINTAEELAWIRDQINTGAYSDAENQSFAGKTIVLGSDIDLSGQEWEPLGVEENNRFVGTFDGNGKTVSNFKITQRHNDKNQAAFIGTIAGSATIKNLTIANAEVICPDMTGKTEDYYGAAVVGSAYGTNTFSNITVKDSHIEGNNKVAAILAHDAEGKMTFSNCHVINCTLESNVADDGGNVGGLVGLLNGDSEDLVENCSVKISTINAYNSTNTGKRSNGQFIGCLMTPSSVTGIVLRINNCEIEGNTLNQKQTDGTDVTYVSPYGELVGGYRDTDGYIKGRILIDGLEAVADGVGINAAGEYEVSSVKGLKWLASEVNSAANDFKGKTVKLTSDLNLNNEEWTPIGTKKDGVDYPFKGTFDGNGHTISNLKITRGLENLGPNNRLGFFGLITGAEIKNLTIENVSIKGALQIGTVCGAPTSSKFSKITVKGLIQLEGMSYVGGVVGYAYATMTDITVDASEGSYVKADSGTSRTYVGGVIGFSGEGNCAYTNLKSNIDVEASTTNAGGISGLAHYGNSFVNCSSSGKVTLTGIYKDKFTNPETNNPIFSERIGGIASQWNNGAGDVTFTDCEFTGELVTYMPETDLSDNTIVGSRYEGTGSGKLIIDGKVAIVISPKENEDPSSVQNSINTAVATNDATVTMPDGTYTLPASLGTGVTITGTEDTILNLETSFPSQVSDLTIDGITLEFSDSQQYIGFTHSEDITISNCTINGCVMNYPEEVVFEKCQFNQTTDSYNIWTYGGTKVSFIECDFYSAEGKGVLIFQDGSDNDQTITFEKCTFKSDKAGQTWDKKNVTAIDIDSTNGTGSYVININSCTVDGFAVGSVSNTNQWNHKAGNNPVTVNIDGVQVYTNVQ